MKKNEKKQSGLSAGWLCVLLVLSVACAAWPFFTMRGLDEALMEPEPHYGIVAFELAYTPEKAGEIVRVWGDDLVPLAKKSLIVDYPFMPAYALLFFALTRLFALIAGGRMGVWTRRAALFPLAAAIFDAVENVGLLSVVASPDAIPAWAPVVAGIAATIKFSLLLLAMLTWPAAVLARLVAGKKPEPQTS
ncbi:MAG: hypothetical protein JW885_11790 [Deltaproteobacteria bacterium]|nr:hypothetical protein [Candidatus Zymogenaceae bacterium]